MNNDKIVTQNAQEIIRNSNIHNKRTEVLNAYNNTSSKTQIYTTMKINKTKQSKT